MKLNLSIKQYIFAFIYSALFPLAYQIDMQKAVHDELTNHQPIMTFYAALISFPFLPIGFFGGTIIAKDLFGGIEFISISIYFCILLQVVLTIYFLNKRKNRLKNKKANKTLERNSLP